MRREKVPLVIRRAARDIGSEVEDLVAATQDAAWEAGYEDGVQDAQERMAEEVGVSRGPTGDWQVTLGLIHPVRVLGGMTLESDAVGFADRLEAAIRGHEPALAVPTPFDLGAEVAP